MQKKSVHQPAFAVPTLEEMTDFLCAVEPTLFGPEYVILGKNAAELVLCEVRLRAKDGRLLHASVLPFN